MTTVWIILAVAGVNLAVVLVGIRWAYLAGQAKGQVDVAKGTAEHEARAERAASEVLVQPRSPDDTIGRLCDDEHEF